MHHTIVRKLKFETYICRYIVVLNTYIMYRSTHRQMRRYK